MVNQSIEQLLQQAVDQSMAQTQESRELADDVSGLIGDIRNEVAQAVQRTEQAITDVNAAIPSAVEDQMYQKLYLDSINGDDSTADGSNAKPFKTLKALIDSCPIGSSIEIVGNNGQTIDIDSDIIINNKNIRYALYLSTINATASIYLYACLFRTGNGINLNQNVYNFIYYHNADVSLYALDINPGANAASLSMVRHASGFGGNMGTFQIGGLGSSSVSDAANPYYLCDRQNYDMAVIALIRNISMGSNVDTFSPNIEETKFGTKPVYMLAG
ncbi:hypothetical protein [Vibrio methylphosphonaticus]|uniref:hypothetical protein n=1 Tax=Vibrio methylphosphonaticus TaxID=2946866 RepID=UPI00202A2889|nr:hypothetical protein [Vibrio methylphosphonaticus]MCL9775698.1 hypothetical protein [Vibrio methylphosphonaticus]